LSINCSANLIINEVMYNPEPNDNYNEWIEIFNPTNKSINISGWSISDNSGEDFIEADYEHGNGTLTIPPLGYAIITDHGTKAYENYTFANSTISLYIDDKSIGNGLGNSGDKIVLKTNSSEIVDSLEWITNYTDIFGSPAKEVRENFTLSRYKTGNNSSKCFYEGFPTPGYENIINMKGEISLTINQTEYLIEKEKIKEIGINVKNLADFPDNITLTINQSSQKWSSSLQKSKINLQPNEKENISLLIEPYKKVRYCNFTISAKSELDGSYENLTLFFEVLGSDLAIRQIKIYDEEKIEKNIVNQGEIIRIKAYFKNLAKEETSGTYASFYYDEINKDHLIGSKYYESVGKYQKYPSVLWDTVDIEPGIHEIIVVADSKKNIEEFDEGNNILSWFIEIIDTSPSNQEKQILISEFYYHARRNLNNEYIKIFNPTSEKINISGWYFTNKPEKNKLDQNKLRFPENTIIRSNDYLILTQNASAYFWETKGKPDFEYKVNSDGNIPQMNSTINFILSNKGDCFALKNEFNHSIDVIVYGESNLSIKGWDGGSIPSSGEGVICKRNLDYKKKPIDTNTSLDWIHPREFRIGQSNFAYVKFNFNGEIKTFVSPDSSYDAITSELKNASKCIYLNVYEFTSLSLCDEIINALIRNVTVNILLDGSPVGGISLEEKYILKRISNYGGNIRFIKSISEKNSYSRYSFNHGKYLVIDNSTTIIESCNWADTGVPKNPSFGNREWGVIIENSSVADYYVKVFLEDWDINRCDIFSMDEMDFNISENYYLFENGYRGNYRAGLFSKKIYGNFTVYPVLSPDTSLQSICNLIDSAKETIYVEQLYIYKDWDAELNPFVERLINKSKNGIEVKVILNYNPFYDSTIEKCNVTKYYLEQNGIEVKYIYTNWSIFTNVHNKGMIVDNKSVLISSINWNENSVTRNREVGIIIENDDIAKYYADVFSYDWDLKEFKPTIQNKDRNKSKSTFDKNTIYIIVIFTMTFAIIARDWRKRQWHY